MSSSQQQFDIRLSHRSRPSDGVTEAVNPDGEEWGVEGLGEAANESAAQCSDDIADATFTLMDEFARGCQTDNATGHSCAGKLSSLSGTQDRLARSILDCAQR
jgi:hypothetical protein